MKINYEVSKFHYDEDGYIEDIETEVGECSPESVMAVMLVHYPINEGWEHQFWSNDG